MRKIKKIELQLSKIQNEFNKLVTNFNCYKLNIQTRDFLISTNFYGNISNAQIKKELEHSLFLSNNNRDKYTFNQVKEQILHYDFQCISNVITVINKLEEKKSNEKRPRQNNKISGKIVDTKISKTQTPKTQKAKKISVLDAYSFEHPNEYFIQNIDEFYKNARLINRTYRPSKAQVITLINVILKYKTFENVMCALNCAKSTLGKYLSNLTKMEITTGNYKNEITLNDKLIVSKFFKKY